MAKHIMNIRSFIVVVAAFSILGLFLSINSIGETSISRDYSSGLDPNDPNVTSLIGIWDVSTEFYEGTSITPSIYGTASHILVITEQTGRVFTGYQLENQDATDLEYINGAIVGSSIRIGSYDADFHGILDPNQIMITGSYNTIQLSPGDNDHETGVSVARKRSE